MDIKKKLKKRAIEKLNSEFNIENKHDLTPKNVEFSSLARDESIVNASKKTEENHESFDAIEVIKKNHFIFRKIPFVCICLTVMAAIITSSISLTIASGKPIYEKGNRAMIDSFNIAKNDLKKIYNEKNTALLYSNYLGENIVINLFSNKDETNYYIQIYDSFKKDLVIKMDIQVNGKIKTLYNNLDGASFITLLNDSSLPVIDGDILFGSVYLNNIFTTNIIYNF